MKLLGKTILTLIIALLLIVPGAIAFPIQGGQLVEMRATIHSSPHAPYTMIDIPDQQAYTSFCIQSQVTFNNFTQYTVSSVQENAVKIQSEWLYAAFVSGFLGTDNQTANDVQKAIWYWEGQVGGTAQDWGIFSSRYNQYSSLFAGWDVRAVILQGAQNQLVGVAPVPEPATLLLLGTGLISIAGLGRKRQKK